MTITQLVFQDELRNFSNAFNGNGRWGLLLKPINGSTPAGCGRSSHLQS